MPDAVDAWVTGDEISKKGLFQARTIPFELFQMGESGPMLDGIELAPFAKSWYVEIVRETVRHLAPQGSVRQPWVDRCEAGIRITTAHGNAEEADRKSKMRRQNWFKSRSESD